MLTQRLAADILRRSTSPTGANALLATLGFSQLVAPDTRSQDALGISSATLEIARKGRLAAATLDLHESKDLREELRRISSLLSSRAPQFLWLVLLRSAGADRIALGTRADLPSGPRFAALIVDIKSVKSSDAETLSALVGAAQGPESLVHLRWFEILGRQALSARFYRALESSVQDLAESIRTPARVDQRSLALTCASRLLFLSFLQSRGWLNRDTEFLLRQFERIAQGGGGLHRRLLDPLFFGTLNTPRRNRAPASRALGRIPFLNGGLFARSADERACRKAVFSDESLWNLHQSVLAPYRFSPREEQNDWSESAIDPEILGRAFEGLMASTDRRNSGAFYTPLALVSHATDSVLSELLEDVEPSATIREQLLAGQRVESPAVLQALARVRILDPACGSGAFLVHLLERISLLMRNCGDQRLASDVRRHVLTRSIFGVDVNPMAVWLCELRLWLAVVIDMEVDDPYVVEPLPNLDRNICVGDSLLGPAWCANALPSKLAIWRERYARASGRRKISLARTLDAEERRLSQHALTERIDCLREERRSLLIAARGTNLFGQRRGALPLERARAVAIRTQLRALRRAQASLSRGAALPFAFHINFADVAANGGFDVVVGNPPWVRLHRIPVERRDELRRSYRVYRDSAWKSGAESGNVATGFAGQVDLAALFCERSLHLTRRGGLVALLLPVKLWRALAGGGVRRLLGDDAQVRVLEDWSEAPSSFDAAVYPSFILVRRASQERDVATSTATRLTVHKKQLAISWTADWATVPLDASPGAPWLLLPPDVRRAFSRLTALGKPLGRSHFGQPVLGVKCGCNDAFVSELVDDAGPVATIRTVRGLVRVEREMLRPVLRGEAVRKWSTPPSPEQILWTHDRSGQPLAMLPAYAQRWFGRWRHALVSRSDARPNVPWWSLFRIDGVVNDRPRVVWADMSRGPRACVLPAGSPVVALNSCYVLPCRDDVDAAALVALFNSPIVAAWLAAIAEPARGGFKRYLGWTIARLPIPHDWQRARRVLAPLGARGVNGENVSDLELSDGVQEAYGLSKRAVEDLMGWLDRDVP